MSKSAQAGYSGTPLARKLGIKPGARIAASNAPPHYRELLSDLPADVVVTNRVQRGAKFVHLFLTKRSDLARRLEELRKHLDERGTLWISWPKKSSGVETDITEDVIRAEALPLGFVD